MRGATCNSVGLTCCGGQLEAKCNDLKGEKACPTHQAVRLLRAKVRDGHGSAACLEKARAAAAAAEGTGPSSGACYPYAVLLGAQATLRNAVPELQAKIAAAAGASGYGAARRSQPVRGGPP